MAPGDAGAAGRVAVLGYREALREEAGFDAVISIEDVETSARLRRLPGRPQLVLAFDDLDHDDGETVVASAAQLRAALAFARIHRGGGLLVHCQAGLCRSPAVALAVLADRLGPGAEDDAVRRLFAIRPGCGPNLVALAAADEALGRGGRLRDAWMAAEKGDEALARMRFLKAAAHALFRDPPARGPAP